MFPDTDPQAFDWAVWGAALLLIGAILQALLSVLERVGHRDPLHGWPWAFGWGLIACGAFMTFSAALHFS